MTLRRAGLTFMIVDAAAQRGGSWQRYYDSLTLSHRPRSPRSPDCGCPDGAAATQAGTTWHATSRTTRLTSSCPSAQRQRPRCKQGAFELTLAGRLLHSASYQSADRYAGQRVWRSERAIPPSKSPSNWPRWPM